MRYQGRLQDWNDEKGFGFVTPNGGGPRAFVHIKAFDHLPQRPCDGVLISYAPHKDVRGRLNAGAVRFAAAGKPQPATARGASPRMLPRTALGLLALLAAALGWIARLVPDAVMGAVLGLSLLTLLFYVTDKAAAQRNRWRTPESTLHLLALLGGWPGALVAQGLFHHKTSKRSFQRTFWTTVVLNVAGLAVLIALSTPWAGSLLPSPR